MDQTSVVDEFGKLLMSRVRDEGIARFDETVGGKRRSHWAHWMRENLSDFTPQQLAIVRKIVVRSVDSTIHELLWMFEESTTFSVSGISSSGAQINLVESSDGLSGEPYSEDGWIERFSKYRADTD